MKFFGVTIRRDTLRGRVARVSVTKASEVSVVVRFGLEELERVNQFMPGTLLEVVEVPADKKAKGSEPKKL